MPTPRRPGKARIAGEHYTHRHLWHAAEVLEANGVANESDGGISIMASMLFVYLALEAYLNEIGPRVCPAEWADERKFFSSEPYRGTLGKLRLLLDRLAISYQLGSKPYQTVAELDSRRDQLVHARPEAYDRVVTFKDSRNLKSPDPKILRFSDERFLKSALTDVEKLADSIQEVAQASLGESVIWSPRAFRGMIGHHSGSILEMPTE